jgi:hypothetical protein
MAADFSIKAGDTQPVLTDTLTYSDGNPANLTGATVAFVLRSQAAQAPVALTGTVAVTGTTTGQVNYTFSAADTAKAGMFMASWVVTFPNQARMTFPTVGYLWVSVEENLTDPGGAQLVSLPDVKDYLNLPPTDRAHDAKLIRFIHAVRPVVEGITGPILPTVYEEWHDGGHWFVQVRRRPSTGPGTSPVLRLVGCDEYRGSTKYPLTIIADPSQGSIYSVHMDQLGRVTRRSAGGGVISFPAMPESVHVVYEAGQSVVPANVYEGTLELLRVNYQTTMAVGRGRMTVADEQDTGPPLGFFVPRRVHEMLGANRRHPSIA